MKRGVVASDCGHCGRQRELAFTLYPNEPVVLGWSRLPIRLLHLQVSVKPEPTYQCPGYLEHPWPVGIAEKERTEKDALRVSWPRRLA